MGMLLTRHYADREKNEQIREKGVTKEVAPTPSAEENANANANINMNASVSVDDIKAMSGTKLRKIAAQNGIENPEDLTVGELKAILVEKFS